MRPGWPFSEMGLVHLENRSRSYASIGVHGAQPISVTVQVAGEPAQVQLLPVDAGFWTTLGVAAAHGRMFTPEEDVPGVAPLALLSDAFWREHFGADASVIGSTLEVNGFPAEVVGVTPASLRYPFPETDVYVSARIDRTSTVVNHSWHVVAPVEGRARPRPTRIGSWRAWSPGWPRPAIPPSSSSACSRAPEACPRSATTSWARCGGRS